MDDILYYKYLVIINAEQTQGTQALNECRVYYKLIRVILDLRNYLPPDHRRALEVVIRE